MSAAGVNHVSRKVERPLDVVWSVLEYCANTVIFLLAGALVAARVYTNASNASVSDIKWFDYPMALVLWVYLLLARAAMFVLFWPVLKRVGYGMTPREGLVLAWSGLRGAVGLSLSLFVVLDFQHAPALADRQFGELCFFYMGAITLLTLLVQGVTMAPLLRALGMTKPPSVRRSFLKLLLRQVEARGDERMRLAAEDRVLGDPDWREVGELSALEASEMLKRYESHGAASKKKKKKGKRSEKESTTKKAAAAPPRPPPPPPPKKGLRAALAKLVPASLRRREAAAEPEAATGKAGVGVGDNASASAAVAPRLPSRQFSRLNSSWSLREDTGAAAETAGGAAAAASSSYALGGFLRRRTQSMGSLAAAAALAEEAHVRAVAARMNRGALLAERRSRLLAAVRQTYNDLFHDAFIDSGQIYALRTASDRALDDLGSPLSDWDRLAPEMALPSWVRHLMQRAGDAPLASRWARSRLLRALDNSMTLALAFMHAHEVTASDILDVWGDGAEFGHEPLDRGGVAMSSGGLIIQGLDSNPADAAAPAPSSQPQQQQQQRKRLPGVDDLLDEMKANVTRQVLLESAAEVEKAAAAVARARAAWPEVARAIKTRQLAQELLLLKGQRVEAVAKTGLIADAEVQALQGLVERKLKSLHFRPPRFGGGRPLDILREHPLLSSLSAAAFAAEVAPFAKLFVADEGEVLSRAGSPADSVVVVTRGCVLLQVEGRRRGGGGGRTSGSVGGGVAGPFSSYSSLAPAFPSGGQFGSSSRPTSAAASPPEEWLGIDRDDDGARSVKRKEAAFAATAALLSSGNSGYSAAAAAAAAAASASPASKGPSYSATGGGSNVSSPGDSNSAAAASPPPVALAAAGAVLFAWPVMLRVPHAATATAASVTLGYRLPARAFEALLRGSGGGVGGGGGHVAACAASRDAVSRCAWQAAAAELAVAHGGPSLAGHSLAELATLFRAAHVEDLERGDTLRAAGAAFMVYGRATRKRSAAAAAAATSAGTAAASNQARCAENEPAGPCMLPEEPAAYVCESRCKVMHLPAGCLEMRGGGGFGVEFGVDGFESDDDDSDGDDGGGGSGGGGNSGLSFSSVRYSNNHHGDGDDDDEAALSAWRKSVERDQLERRRQSGGQQAQEHEQPKSSSSSPSEAAALQSQQQQRQEQQPAATQLVQQQRQASFHVAPSAFSGCAPRSSAPAPRRGLGRFEPGSSLVMPSGDEALLAALVAGAAPPASASTPPQQQGQQLPRNSPLAASTSSGDYELLAAAAAASQRNRQQAQQLQQQPAAAPAPPTAATALAAPKPKNYRRPATSAPSRPSPSTSRHSFDSRGRGGGGSGAATSRAAGAASRLFGAAAAAAARRRSIEAPEGLGVSRWGSVDAVISAGGAGGREPSVAASGGNNSNNAAAASFSAATVTSTSGRRLAKELADRLSSVAEGPLHPVHPRGGGGGSDVEAGGRRS